jgi:hypothetical protein
MLAVTGPFVSLIQYRREVKGQDNVNSNVRIILEIIDKELRTGKNVVLSGDGTGISFVNQEGQNVSYSFIANKIQKTIAGNTVDITRTNILYVDNFKFVVKGDASNDLIPTTVTIMIEASENVNGGNKLKVQSTTLLRNRF